MSNVNPFIEKVNLIFGAIGAVMAYVLGDHWVLFAAFLLLNIVDYVTGTMKAYMAGKENSGKGFKGVVKKIGYWIMVMLGFGMNAIFVEIGEVIGIDLSITSLIGWAVLCVLIVNEIRSILENLVEAGFNPPKILINGLEVVNKAIDGKIHIHDDGSIEMPGMKVKDDGTVILDEAGEIMEQLLKKGSYTFQLDEKKDKK